MNTVNNLLESLNEDIKLSQDEWSIEHQFESGMRKWIANIVPAELLKRTIKEAVESIVTLCHCYSFYEIFPDNIESPNYGDNWGVSANYIEINNRAIAEMQGNSCKNGILSAIKILPQFLQVQKAGQIVSSFLRFSQTSTVMAITNPPGKKIPYTVLNLIPDIV